MAEKGVYLNTISVYIFQTKQVLVYVGTEYGLVKMYFSAVLSFTIYL